eukprot:742565-Prorocentrum_minimum.AAC.1
MGFPATTGAPYMDYLVTDRVVAPPRLKRCYSESLVYMPHCYFVNDYKQSHQDVLDARNLPSRQEVGLPEGKARRFDVGPLNGSSGEPGRTAYTTLHYPITDVMLAGPKGRVVGESGELDTG